MHILKERTTRKKLTRELEEVRSLLSIEKEHCRKLYQELAHLKTLKLESMSIKKYSTLEILIKKLRVENEKNNVLYV